MTEKILLHMCCGPCACWPTKKLREENFEPVGFFFNPNIHPYMEWKLRLKTAREFSEKVGMNFFADNHYRLREFLEKVLPVTDEADTIQFPDGFHKRCGICYSWRLGEAARFAAENNFETFTSTLFYSRHQNHELMKKIAETFAKKFGVKFFYEDFRVGWLAAAFSARKNASATICARHGKNFSLGRNDVDAQLFGFVEKVGFKRGVGDERVGCGQRCKTIIRFHFDFAALGDDARKFAKLNHARLVKCVVRVVRRKRIFCDVAAGRPDERNVRAKMRNKFQIECVRKTVARLIDRSARKK